MEIERRSAGRDRSLAGTGLSSSGWTRRTARPEPAARPDLRCARSPAARKSRATRRTATERSGAPCCTEHGIVAWRAMATPCSVPASWPCSCVKPSSASSAGYASASARMPADAARCPRPAGARLGHLVQRAALVAGVAPDGGREVRDDVVAALELHLHVGGGGLGGVSQPHEPVVPEHEHDEQRREQPHEDHEEGEPAASVGSRGGRLECRATNTTSSPPL
jgi:hypothetical protein